MPEVIEEKVLSTNEPMPIANLLRNAELVESTSDAYRAIDQGGVRIDGEKVLDRNLKIATGTEHIYQVGKRKFLKIFLKKRD
jgi:tyrosyl-tRNA synthetase